MIDKEKIEEGVNKRLPINEDREPIHPFNQHQFLRREGFRKGVKWALEQVKNNSVLDDVINCKYSLHNAKIQREGKCPKCGGTEMFDDNCDL